jgi:hypothetical protein
LNVPGSLSSALQQMYFGFGDFLSTNCHFMPVGNPAPPRPAQARRLDRHRSPRPGVIASAFLQRAVPAASSSRSRRVVRRA